MVHVSYILFNKSFTTLGSWRYSSVLTSKSLCVLPFTFRVIVHLELIFVWYEVAVKFHFSYVDFKLFQHRLLKNLHFPLLSSAAIIVGEGYMWVWICFWTLRSVLVIHFYFWLYRRLNYCTFIVSFDVWYGRSPNSVLIQEYFSLCDAVCFYINFKIRLSISIHTYICKYTWKRLAFQRVGKNYTEFINYFGENWPLYNNEASNLWK